MVLTISQAIFFYIQLVIRIGADISSVVWVGNLRSESPTVNREKVTKGRQQSNVHDFARCHGVLPLGAQLHLLPQNCTVFQRCTVIPASCFVSKYDCTGAT